MATQVTEPPIEVEAFTLSLPPLLSGECGSRYCGFILGGGPVLSPL